MTATAAAAVGLAITAASVAVAVLSWVWMQLRRSGGAIIPDSELLTVGARGLATVLRREAVDESGSGRTVASRFEFAISPSDGDPSFVVVRDLVVAVDDIPEPGVVWPAWYLPSDRTQVLVAVPSRRPSLMHRGGTVARLEPVRNDPVLESEPVIAVGPELASDAEPIQRTGAA